MSFLKKILGQKDQPIKSNSDFWSWFEANEQTFFKVVKDHGTIEKQFFNKLAPKLNELKEGFFYLTGMHDDHTAELIFTADGSIKNFAFVEDLVNSAPLLRNWKFTAFKPALDAKDVNIEMSGYTFGTTNMYFYANDHRDFPDEIDITVVHNDLREKNNDAVSNGSFIFLDNFLGELNFATTIDTITIIGKDKAQKELVPIEKLKDFLIWREKEFIEKYSGIRYNTEKDNYSVLEARLQNGNSLLAVVNTDLLEWDSKPSHPWILTIEIKFDGGTNGMPDNTTYELLEQVENEVLAELKDFEGYLSIGRQTAEGIREIYFACKDFRKPSKISEAIRQKYSDQLDMSYNIYRDKYWQSFNRFIRRP
jgi:hypothetical protein